MTFHDSVLVFQSVDGLKVLGNTGVYLDTTFGGGGHSKSILTQLSDKGHLYAFDQDEDAKQNAEEWGNFTFIASNFRHLKRWMKYYNVQGVNGILADLGVSSHQFDEPTRGFSYRFEELLDMRMNQSQVLSAIAWIENTSLDEMAQVFRMYGDIPNAQKLASEINTARKLHSIRTTTQLIAVIEPRILGNRMKYLSQVFQSIRIAVNDELGALKDLLQDGMDLLLPGGRFVIMSYHSLEDRLVKNFFKTGNFEGHQVKDEYGKIERPFKLITKKPIVPDAAEIKRNVRARSAKLRIAEKI